MKDPAFLFYSSDFLSGTMLMDNEQIGKYIRLLCLQHQKGHLKEKDMLNICNSYDEDIFSKFKQDDENNYYNERLEYEVQRRKAYSESRRSNRKGKKEDKKENNICETYDEDMNNICETYVKHMENETATTTENINKNIKKNIKKEENEKNCINFYIKNINPLISQYEFETLNDFSKELSDEIMIYAMKDAIEHNAKNMKYLKTIFSRYIAQGIKTVEQAEAQQKGYNKQIKQETEEERKERIIKYLKENCEEYEEEKEKPKKINKILKEEEVKIIL